VKVPSTRRIANLVRWSLYHKPRSIVRELSTLWKIQVLLRFLPRESSRAFAATLFLGALCGLIAVGFHGSLEAASHWAGRLHDVSAFHLGWVLVVVLPMASAWVAGLLLVRSGLPAAGSGIPQVKAALLGRSPAPGARVGVVKSLLCVLQVGGGASLGREGPTVQICASVVPRVLRLFALPPSLLRRFLPVASAAGIAAAFNTPIAAVTFVMEELVGSSTPTVMTGLVVAAAIAAIEEKLLLGGHPLFHVPSWSFESLASLPSFVMLGLLCGILGAFFHRALLALRIGFRKLDRLDVPTRMALGGLLTGCASWIGIAALGSRGIAGPGYAILDGSLHDGLTSIQVAGLLPLKFLATLASYSSGGVGGIFSPVLAIGSLLGRLAGTVQSSFPWADDTPLGAFALIGMGAFFASVIRAPITSVLILFELTGNYGLILPLMLANMAAFLVSKRMNPLPIYDALLVQDGIDPHEDAREKGPLVGELADGEIRRVPADAPFEPSAHLESSSPLVVEEPDGTCVGLIDRTSNDHREGMLLRDLVGTRARLRSGTLAFEALSLMSQEDHRWLPVVDEKGRAVAVFGSREALAHLAERGRAHPPSQDDLARV